MNKLLIAFTKTIFVRPDHYQQYSHYVSKEASGTKTLRHPGARSTATIAVAGAVVRGAAVHASASTVLIRHLGRLGGVGVALYLRVRRRASRRVSQKVTVGTLCARSTIVWRIQC